MILKIAYSYFYRFVFMFFAAMCLWGCSSGEDKTEETAETRTYSWSSPAAVDIESVDSEFLSFDSTTSKSYGNFRLERADNQAAFISTFVYNETFVPFGRMFFTQQKVEDSENNLSEGWADYGDYFSELKLISSDIYNVDLSFNDDSDLLMVFSGSAASITYSVLVEDEQAIGDVDEGVFSASFDESLPLYGQTTSLVWTSSNQASFAFVNPDDSNGYISQYDTSTSSWSELEGPSSLEGVASAISMLFDGFGLVSLLYENSEYLTSSWFLEEDSQLDNIAGCSDLNLGDFSTDCDAPETIKSFDLATNDLATAVSVFVKQDPDTTSSDCDDNTIPQTVNCDYRIYASVRNAQGEWVDPQPLDESLDNETTTHYQDANTLYSEDTSNEKDYYTPQVAYIGDNEFLAVFTVNDNEKRTSKIYSRKYTVSGGWSEFTAIETTSLVAFVEYAEDDDADDFESAGLPGSYRAYNEFHLSSDENGNALLVVHAIVKDAEDPEDREFGYKIFRYTSGTWELEKTVEDEYACRVSSNSNCHLDTVRPQGVLFSSGEATVLLESPSEEGSEEFRLYSISYQ